jgi:hypothetical protein
VIFVVPGDLLVPTKLGSSSRAYHVERGVEMRLEQFAVLSLVLSLTPTLASGQSNAFDVRVLQAGEARVNGDREYEGKLLTGVLLEVTSLKPGATATLDASAANVSGPTLKPVAAAILFLAKGFERNNISFEAGAAGAQTLGLEITIGQTTFEAHGANPLAHSLVGRTGGTFVFEKPETVHLGLVFATAPKDVTHINVFQRNLRAFP